MFTAMPYENSLVVLRMNGPQLKAVLERAYRNYYYYKYVPGYGGYSYYTTCMLDTNSVGKITYNDLYPAAYDAAKSNVTSLTINGVPVDFTDATKYYKVSTVNYLAAGSCNFNDGGVSLWPLNQIVNDTQYYVRDAVIDYITAKGTVSPAIEGRLAFVTDTTAPVITITMPAAKTYWHSDQLKLAFGATDTPAGVLSVTGQARQQGRQERPDPRPAHPEARQPHLHGQRPPTGQATGTSKSVTFKIKATVKSLIRSVNLYYDEHKITSYRVKTRLLSLLRSAEYYRSHSYYRAARVHAVRVHLDGGRGVGQRIIVSGAARAPHGRRLVRDDQHPEVATGAAPPPPCTARSRARRPRRRALRIPGVDCSVPERTGGRKRGSLRGPRRLPCTTTNRPALPKEECVPRGPTAWRCSAHDGRPCPRPSPDR